MKIGIDVRALEKNPAGIGNYIRGFLFGLSQIETDRNEYFLYGQKGENLGLDFLKQNSQRVTFSENSLFWYFRVWQDCQKRKLDYFYSTHSNLFSFFPKVKTILAVHDLSAILFPNLHTQKVRILAGKLFLRHALKKASLIIVPSRATYNDLIKLFPSSKEKVKVIYDGLPIISDEGKDVSKNRFERINFPFLLYLGTIEPRKNLIRLIEVFSRLKREKQVNHKLIIAGGKGWFYKSIFDKVKELDLEKEIIFAGYVTRSEKLSLFTQASVFCFPSLYEGFGFPVLEAMAYGVSILTSDISSLPEITGKDYPYLVNPKDQDDIYRKLLNLLELDDKDREKIIEINREKSQEFNWGKNATEWLEEVKKI